MRKTTEKGDGYVYIITNPAWLGFSKIGMSKDVLRRLKTYQTYSPNRDYSLHYYRWTPNARKAEAELFKNISGFSRKGEWFALNPDDATILLDNLMDRGR
jgi:hypothetical protein